MKKSLSILTILITTNIVFGQLTPPYTNNFDNQGDTTGWSHYAITGNDDWEFGIPSGNTFSEAYSSPYAWATNLAAYSSTNSDMILETPVINLSDTSKIYVLSFEHKTSSSSYTDFYLEYSLNNSNIWIILNNSNVQKNNWQNSNGFPYNQYNQFNRSAIELSFIQGNDSVRFRFRMITGNYSGEGWLIDDFNILEEYSNLSAYSGDTTITSSLCPEIEFNTTVGYYNQFSSYFSSRSNFYFSTDTILDLQDSLITYKNYTNSSSFINWNITFSIPSNITVGTYYIIYIHDALETMVESNESDNIDFEVLIIDPIITTPYTEDFENCTSNWTPELSNSLWESGIGYRHHLEGTHSGANAWHTGKTMYSSSNNYHRLESPYIDLTNDTGNIVQNFWYKNKIESNSYWLIYSANCGSNWSNVCEIPACEDDEWDFMNISLNSLNIYNNIKFGYTFNNGGIDAEGLIIDDIYIGIEKPDLSIERNKFNRFTTVSSTTDSLKYYLFNCGIGCQQSYTSFYWSTDTIADSSDILLGTKTEQAMNDTSKILCSFSYTKPTLIPGKYYLLYFLDTANTIDEMREYNNFGYFTLYQENNINIPYYNDFETQIDGWRHNASLGNDDWQWTIPAGSVLDSAFSPTKAWITADTGLLSECSRMHLYTPVFDFSTASNPVLAFDMKLDLNPNGYHGSGMTNMSYSIDGGANWEILDTNNQSFNRWYYRTVYDNGIDEIYTPLFSELFFDFREPCFVDYTRYNGRDTERNTRYIIDLSAFSGIPKIQFRFNTATLFNSNIDQYLLAEGALIDNFSIREAFVDLTVKYKKSLMISSISNKISFYMHIKNQGNYISTPCITNFYLSADSILDSNDDLIGQTEIPAIRPDFSQYILESFNTPPNFSNYKYLIYDIDVLGTIQESNESNNTGYWPLALDSIKTYPYYNDFNDSIIDGWHQYSIDSYYPGFDDYRFRNVLAPTEETTTNYKETGQWFTDIMPNYYNSLEPCLYLVSPVFSFSLLDSIFLSFDLLCTGSTSSYSGDGGNMSFSVDGGNTWSVLDFSYGHYHNWYNMSSIYELNYEPGWTGQPTGGSSNPVLDSIAYDISFLKGKKNVVFRYKYKSKYQIYGMGFIQGMRLDNFMIEAFNADYIALDTLSAINANTLNPEISLYYSISNSGQSNGRLTKTEFYWSNDSIFDSSDTLIYSATETPIISGDTAYLSAAFYYPAPIVQTEYYLFYFADSENNILEINENNNNGIIKVLFEVHPNYYSNKQMEQINTTNLQSSFNVTYSIINNSFFDGVNSLTNFYWSNNSIFDINDQIILSIAESPILANQSYSSTATIIYPELSNQTTYYLFYESDSNDDIIELNEKDNIGSFEVQFDIYSNYYANLSSKTINTNISQDYFTVTYSIVNTSDYYGSNSVTAFYWSTDSIFSLADLIVNTIAEPAISPNDTLVKSTSIFYPTLESQLKYYLFYSVDHNDVVLETNEEDNIGSFIIDFDTTNSINYSIFSDEIIAFISNDNLKIQCYESFKEQFYSIELISSSGKYIISCDMYLKSGKNTIPLKTTVSNGIYQLVIKNKMNLYSKKILFLTE